MELDWRYSGFVIKHFGLNHGHELLKKKKKKFRTADCDTEFYMENKSSLSKWSERGKEILSVGGNNFANNTKYVWIFLN